MADDPAFRRAILTSDATTPQLPNIRLIGVIDEGGMGDVLEGVFVDGPDRGQVVAIKRLARDRPLPPKALERLLREAEVTRRLDHRNIVRARDVLSFAGHPYLVMERLVGNDLLHVDAGVDVPEWVAVAIAAQALDGIAYAHAGRSDLGSMIHRDLSPSNLFVCRDGCVKILAFGAARFAEITAELERQLTNSGMVIGTPAFASPEQARADPLDVRSDLFQLAATIYFLLSGKSPYGDVGDPSVLERAAHGLIVPIATLRSDLSPALVEWLERALTPAREERWPNAVEMHVALDAAMGAPADDARLGQWLAALPPTLANDDVGARDRAAATSAIEAETKLGRYVVLDKIAEGGMGVVYAAYDPELDRKIALKLLRAETTSSGNARLLREAQAMARVAHPNTVAIFDVGIIAGRVFLAMELIDGQTLTEWLRSSRRSWREVVEVMLAAGRGLAAAHEAGLVHRDFKPDNVLIGADGRARVTDFGLARRAGLSTELPASPNHVGPIVERLDSSITQAGAIVGTPDYMAPEQRKGHPPDVRTDQFSFAVTLHQALYGHRPFDTKTISENGSGSSSTDAEVPRESSVPRRFAPVIKRALNELPEARYSSMHELLDALAKDPAVARRRQLAWVALAAALAVALWAVRYASQKQVRTCRGAPEQLRDAWDDQIRARVASAFAATGREYAKDTLARTERMLDDYAREWAAMRTDACEATRVRGDQAETVMSLRMLCLDRARAQLKALTEVFASADATVLDRAASATANLPRLSECADVAMLTRDREAPRTQGERARLDEVTAQYAHARSLFETGRYAEGLTAAQSLARSLGDALPRRAAEVHYLEGELLFLQGDPEKAGPAYEEAIYAAERGGYGLYLARSYARYAFVESCSRHYAESQRLARHAESVMAAIGLDPLAETWRLNAFAAERGAVGRVDESLALQERAFQVYSKAYGRDAVAATLMSAVGSTLRRQKPRDALHWLQEGLAVQEALLGSHNPRLAYPLVHLGRVLIALGRPDEAIALLERAIALRRLVADKDDHIIVDGYLREAEAYDEKRDHARALEMAGRARGLVALPQNRARIDALYGWIQVESGAAAEALPALQKAAAIQAAFNWAGGDEDLMRALRAIGLAHHKLGHHAEAIAAIEKARAMAEEYQLPLELAESQFLLARVLWAKPDQRAHAHQLAELALRGFADVPNPLRADSVRDWIATLLPAER
jgi:eukaryotic-like serine/threonine-protein kinase